MGIIGEVNRINRLLEETKDALEEVIGIYTGDPVPSLVEQPEVKSLENELNKADEMSMRILDYSKAILSMFRGEEQAASQTVQNGGLKRWD